MVNALRAGTGKTALARAIATEANAVFFVINGPDIVSEYLGESEACLKGIFAAAKALSPSVGPSSCFLCSGACLLMHSPPHACRLSLLMRLMHSLQVEEVKEQAQPTTPQYQLDL